MSTVGDSAGGCRLDGRAAVVTGAASGIGARVARDLAAAGALVGVLDVDGDGAAAVSEEIVAAGGRALALVADVTDRAAVGDAVRRLAAVESRVDVLVTCAGILRDASLLATGPESWHSVMAVDVGGTLHATEAVAPLMVAGGYGRIVHLGSRAILGDRARVNYVTSKGATTAITKSFALRLGPAGVTVNCVAPGLVRTPMTNQLGDSFLDRFARDTPLRRCGTPEDVSAAVVFLASEPAGFVTGQVLYVCGGRSLVPGPSDSEDCPVLA